MWNNSVHTVFLLEEKAGVSDFIVTTAEPEDVGLCSRRLSRICPWIRAYVEAKKLPGALTLVARRGEVVFLDCLGWRDLEARTPLELNSIFRFYSMSKPITSVAVMMLYEEGWFQLDDPVSKFIPELEDMKVYRQGEASRILCEPAASPITIQQLLTHTSGLTYGFSGDDEISRQYYEARADFGCKSGPLCEVVARLAEIPLVNHPGTRWNYGVSTDVLGYLVEVVSGTTLDRFLAERVFAPLGMVDTAFSVPASKLDRFCSLYGPSEEGKMKLLDPVDGRYVEGRVTTFSGGGGLVSTLSDYYRFLRMLRRRGELEEVRLLSRKTVEYMTTNHLPGDLAAMGQASFNETTFAGIGFGLGFSVMLDPARAGVMGSAGEYSWGGMASTAFWVDPVEDMTVIFLTQLSPSDTYPLRRELRVLTYQALID